MYLLRPDLDGLVEWLNAETAVAWTVPEGGPGRWKAVPTVSPDWVASKWRTGLWFVDSPLITDTVKGKSVLVEDPFRWMGGGPKRIGGVPGTPRGTEHNQQAQARTADRDRSSVGDVQVFVPVDWGPLLHPGPEAPGSRDQMVATHAPPREECR